MSISKITLRNVTVFENLEMQFAPGINIFIGPNGTGKTHMMKLLYSACRASDPKNSFSQKIVRCFGPDDYQISRLLRRKPGNSEALIRVISQHEGKKQEISACFNNKTVKWDASVRGEEGWEKQRAKLSSIFIPAKEILSHSYNLNAAVEMNNVVFDDTYLDVINAAKIAITAGKNSTVKQTLLNRIEEIIEGKVFFDVKRDEFYLKKGNSKVEFNLVAEGIRKIALLWQLVKNGMLMQGSVLFWDEPEANINPKHIPIIAEMLLELQRNGVQVFVSTHDYFLSKYLEIKRLDTDNVMYHSFYFGDTAVQSESAEHFKQLSNNVILDTFIELYQEEMDKVMGS